MRTSAWLLLLACLLVPGSPRAKEPLGRAEFTERVAAELGNVPGLSVTVVRDLELRLVTADGRESSAFLDNAYADLRRTPDDLDAIVVRFAAAARETAERPDQGKVQRDRIVPVVKDRAWLEEARAALRARGKDPSKAAQVWEDYNDELVILYGEDTPRNIRYFSDNDLRAVGVPRDELRRLAVKNLLAILPKVELRGGNGLYMMTAGGDYEASLILADQIWDSGQVKVEGEVVVAIPARDLLLVCGSRDAAAVAKVREIAAKVVKEASYPLTPVLFVRRNGKFRRM